MKKTSILGLAVLLAGAAGAQCNLTPGETGTGNLRVLITDKPFPFEFIEEALVTITKVDIRRAGGSSCEADCNDGLFCNGVEVCVDGVCQAGVAPCEADQHCDEEADRCLNLCEDDADCDDGVFCNGVETCNVDDGLCAAGVSPCGADTFCNEDTDLCDDACTSDSQCDDGLFCNGPETCDVAAGECEFGDAPECEDGRVCDENADACVGENGDDDDGDGNPFIVIFEGERTFNLLDLQNGRADLLAEADNLPAGNYDLMRVFVTRGKVTLTDGAGEFELFVPSGAQTGIKLHFAFEIVADDETQLLLDVDLSRAFLAVPGGRIEDPSTIRMFLFRPSLAMRLINVLDAGSIGGTVTDADGAPIESAAVTAYDAQDTEITSTSTEADGTYLLSGLPTGTYRVEFSATGFNDAEETGVSVTAGQTTDGVDAALSAAN